MKCKIICDLLPLYIDNVCSDETKEAVEEHLKICRECRMEYEKMKADISMHKEEDLDEKELMKKGRETVTEYVKEKLYRKWIFGDTLINLLLTIYIILCVIHGMTGYGQEMSLVLIPLVIFSAADIIYWASFLVKRGTTDSVIVDALCKTSIWMKLLLLVCMIAAAAVVGFYTLLDGWENMVW